MPKVTSKLQITLPKALARQYGIAPGDEISFQPAGEQIRLVPNGRDESSPVTTEQRLQLFDEATARQQARDASKPGCPTEPEQRGWQREELYQRGLAD